MRFRAIVLGIALGVFALDRWSKGYVASHYLPGETFWHLGPLVAFTFVLNRGAAFGLLQNRDLLFIAVAVALLAAVGWILATRKDLPGVLAVGLGLLTGGAAGNLWDRVVSGQVVDFVNFHIWPVFNVADSAIVVGMAVLVLELWRRERGNVESGRDRPSQPDSDHPS
jgi:signal peptidase II